MCIDVRQEQPLSFNQAAQYLPERSRPHSSTWWRWWRHGVRGVRLETVLIGGRRYTTAEAVQRFVSALTAGACGVQSPPRQQQRLTDREIEQQLDAAGITAVNEEKQVAIERQLDQVIGASKGPNKRRPR